MGSDWQWFWGYCWLWRTSIWWPFINNLSVVKTTRFISLFGSFIERVLISSPESNQSLR
jgi:hypothetical protein